MLFIANYQVIIKLKGRKWPKAVEKGRPVHETTIHCDQPALCLNNDPKDVRAIGVLLYCENHSYTRMRARTYIHARTYTHITVGNRPISSSIIGFVKPTDPCPWTPYIPTVNPVQVLEEDEDDEEDY